VTDGFERPFINIQGEGKEEIAIGAEGDQGLDQAPKQIHLADPDTAQTDGFAQSQEKVYFPDVNPDEKQKREKDDEAHGPGIMHGVPPSARSSLIRNISSWIL
jgi:hypothetical protein